MNGPVVYEKPHIIRAAAPRDHNGCPDGPITDEELWGTKGNDDKKIQLALCVMLSAPVLIGAAWFLDAYAKEHDMEVSELLRKLLKIEPRVVAEGRPG